MSAANPNPMEKPMVSCSLLRMQGGGSLLRCGVLHDEHIVFPVLPLPDPMTSSTTMEEMMMQLSVVQNDIQDILEAIRNPPGKRKRWGSNQNTEPTMPMNRCLATNKK
jgi:hypothetical protein